MQSLKGRWFKVSIENVEQLRTVNMVERNCLYKKDGKYYQVLSIFKKSYNKWRHERIGNKKRKNESSFASNRRLSLWISCRQTLSLYL